MIKQIIQKLRGFFCKKSKATICDRKGFKSSQYWEERYSVGRNSGAGSYGRLADFKAEIINGLIAEYHIQSVIEFGCGDGNQLSLLHCPEYMGIDVSPKVIEMIRQKFSNDSTKKFLILSEYHPGEKADMSLSLDVIYHLIEDAVYEQYMRRLFQASTNLVCIYASNYHDESAAIHVRHRKFTDWIAQNLSDWRLLKHIPNRYQFDENLPNDTSFADFYLFAKKECTGGGSTFSQH